MAQIGYSLRFDKAAIKTAEWLAVGLNTRKREWLAIAAILQPSLPRLRLRTFSRESARRFNMLAAQIPVVMRIRERRGSMNQNLVSRTPAGKALVELWEGMWWDAVVRLRRCVECDLWFGDRTKSLRAIYCSRRCLNRSTIREWRRRQRAKQHQAAGQTRGKRYGVQAGARARKRFDLPPAWGARA